MESTARAVIGQVQIDLVDRAAVVDRVDASLRGRVAPVVVTSANLDHVHHFGPRDAPVLPAGSTGTVDWLCLLDGWPLTRATRRQLSGRPEKLPGSELLPDLLGLAAAAGSRVGLVGASEATRTAWREQVPRMFPGLTVEGTWAVLWADLDRPGAGERLAEEIAAAGVDLLVVSLGKPRQELWLRDHIARTGARVALAFGSAVDYVVGLQRRPPELARRLGLEWAVRLAREPRRLSRRYLVEGPLMLRWIRRDLSVRS